MEKYEVVFSEADGDVNKEIARRQENGWELIPPILLRDAVWTKEAYPSPVTRAQLILTFKKPKVS